MFGEALQVFADFLNTAEGMDTLTAVFDTLNSVGAAFGDILQGIGPALPPLISGISTLVGAVSPLIAPLAELVGSLLVALAPIFTAIAAAVQPLIGPITQIVEIIGSILVQAIEAVMPWIETLLGLFSGQLATVLNLVLPLLGAIAPIFEALLPLIEPLIAIMTPFIDLFAQLAEILLAILVPVIQVLGDSLLWLVENVIVPTLVPILEFLADFFAGELSASITQLMMTFELLGMGITIVWNAIKTVITNQVDAIKRVWNALVLLFQVGWSIINIKVITPIKNGFNNLKTAIGITLGGIRTAWNSFTSFITGVPGKIKGALSSMFSPLWDGFRGVINNVIDAWNGLSFSLPSVNIPGIGDVGGATISTPNIPRLQVGGMSMGEGLAHLDPNEAILPLEDQRTENLLAGAIQRALAGVGATGVGAASAAGVGDIYVDVRIGETPLNDIVDTRINVNNRSMVRRARSGTRRSN